MKDLRIEDRGGAWVVLHQFGALLEVDVRSDEAVHLSLAQTKDLHYWLGRAIEEMENEE